MTTQLTTHVPAFTETMMPSLPQEMRSALAQAFGQPLDSFKSGINRISLKSFQINRVSGGDPIAPPVDRLRVIIMGVANEQYNIYYKSQYSQNSENTTPDAVWGANEPIPEIVPHSDRVKNDEGRKGYATRRRLVVLAVNDNGSVDYETPFVFDVNGMSTFGNDTTYTDPMTQQIKHAYSLSNYMRFLKSNKLYPCALFTEIVIDRSEGVPTVKFIPGTDQSGNVALMRQEALSGVINLMQSPYIQELLDWRRSVEDQTSQPQPQPQPVQQPVAQPTAQPALQVEAVPVQQPVAQPTAQLVANTQELHVPNTANLATQMQSAVEQVNTALQAPVEAAQPAPVDDMDAALASLLNDVNFQ